MPTPTQPPQLPRIRVLLATRNGRRWLPEQLASILGQENVDVTVLALDDGSTDGTLEWLVEQAGGDPRVVVLPSEGSSGGAAANFYRLLLRTPVDDAYVAFSDQDDIWMPDKLARHAQIIRSGGYDGVSSNVTAFTANGRRTLVRKSFPQREYDYLLESPGPGSTFLMTPRLVALAREVLVARDRLAASVDYHDWLLYVLARARGWAWYIDDKSTVDYRQHDDNAMGANVGTRSAVSRLRLIREHWHRRQAVLLARIGLEIAGAAVGPGLKAVLAELEGKGIRARFALARRAPQLRRRTRDGRIIALLVMSGIW